MCCWCLLQLKLLLVASWVSITGVHTIIHFIIGRREHFCCFFSIQHSRWLVDITTRRCYVFITFAVRVSAFAYISVCVAFFENHCLMMMRGVEGDMNWLVVLYVAPFNIHVGSFRLCIMVWCHAIIVWYRSCARFIIHTIRCSIITLAVHEVGIIGNNRWEGA